MVRSYSAAHEFSSGVVISRGRIVLLAVKET